MKKELFNKSINLRDSIAPQYFSVQEDGICYFDRINIEEGRFWCIREGQYSVVLEIDKGQGMLDEKGNMYILDSREKTTLIPIHNKRPGEPIELEGVFYDFKISESGSYAFLGNNKESNIIKLKSASGADTAEIQVPELVFASCLELDKEYIYLGGIEREGRLAIASINYLGVVKQSWTLDCSSKERFVGKLQLIDRKIIMLIGGAYDTIGILDMEGGGFKELDMGRLNLKGCADLQVFNDQVYLLSGKTIMSIDIKTLEEMVQYPASGLHVRSKDSLSYEYLMYTKSMRNQVLGSMLPAVVFSSFITILLMITGQIYFESYLQQGLFQLFMAIIGVYLISSLRNITDLVDKSLRVDNLLSLYNESGSLASQYAFPLLAASTVFSFIYLLGFPGIGRLYSWIAGALAMIFFSALQIKSLRKLKLEKDDVIVELLVDDDLETEMAVRAALRSMKSQGCEEMQINIAAVDKTIVRRINRWVKTRSSIIREVSLPIINENVISVTLDFSKRDIRYSRFSIAMDYISYLRKSDIISIADIQCITPISKNKN